MADKASTVHASHDERNVFLGGRTLVLTALTEEDVRSSGWFGWFNDAETTRFMQQRFFPNTVEKQLEFYRSGVLGAANKIQLGILPHGAEAIVGVVSLSNIDFFNRKAEFGIIIGAHEARGKGYGTEAASLIISHGFTRLSLHKIYLGVHAAHKAAIRSYEKVGFRIDGVLRHDILLDGAWHDVVHMSILADEFMQQTALAETLAETPSIRADGITTRTTHKDDNNNK